MNGNNDIISCLSQTNKIIHSRFYHYNKDRITYQNCIEIALWLVSYEVLCRFVPLPGHAKDHHKNGINCPPPLLGTRALG